MTERPSPGATRPRLTELAAAAASRLAAELAELSSEDRERLDRVPLESALSAAFGWPPGKHYYHVPRAFVQAMDPAREYGPAFVALHQRLLLYSLLTRLPENPPLFNMPRSVWETTETGLATLLAELTAHVEAPPDDDLFHKDLALVSLRAVCIGFHVYERVTVAPRRIAAGLPTRQRLALMRYLGRDYLRSGPYGSSHAWRGFRELRGKEAWQVRFLRIAEMLEANPDLKGQFGSSWLSDPALQTIAPHLAARADGLRAIGAHSFPVGVNARATGHALATSETRRRLYAEGSYIPVEWATITTRTTLINWARAYRRDGIAP